MKNNISQRDSASSPTPQSKSTSTRVNYQNDDTFNKVCNAIAAGNSVIVLGEAGTGKGDFAQALHKEMLAEFECAIATY